MANRRLAASLETSAASDIGPEEEDSFPQAGTTASASDASSAPGAAATIPQLAHYLVNGFWQYHGTIGHRWASNTITYNVSGLNAAEQFLARSALNAWHEVANLTFVETSGAANITFTHNGTMTAYETDSYTGSGIITSATINISADWITNDGGAYDGKTGIDSYGYQTYVHEVGHALGLGHQGPYNGSASYSSNALFANDTWQYSIMSYFAQQNYSGSSYRYVVTPQMADIYAAGLIYGAATTRTGDTTYGFNSTAGSIYNFASYTQAPALTIYDSGGTDTLDCSGYSSAQRIDLRAGYFSSVGGLTNNVGIATSCVLENAVAGAGSDTLHGNTTNNRLTGGSGFDSYGFSVAGWGADRIVDSDGTGRIIFTGVSSVSSLTRQFTGTISGGDYILTDLANSSQIILQGASSVASWTFGYTSSDFITASNWTAIGYQTMSYVPNTAPVVSVTGSVSVQTFGNGAPSWTSGNLLPFTVSDADGDAIVRYRVTDVGTASTSAVLWYDGSFLAQGATVEFTAANLPNFWLEGGTVNGTDTLRIQTYDGYDWSAARDISIVTGPPPGNDAPVVSVTGSVSIQTFGHGAPSWTSGNLLPFTTSDADGDAISRYRVTDLGTASTSAILWYGGSFLAQGATIEFTAANLQNFWLEGGTVNGTDTLRVQAYDGYQWSAARDISIVTGRPAGNDAPLVSVTGSVSLEIFGNGAPSWTSGNLLPFTVSDADSDAIARYRVTDVGTASTSAVLWYGGAFLAQGATVEFTAANLANFWLEGGTVAGTDTLRIQAYDGYEWGVAQNISIVTGTPQGNDAPALSVTGSVSVRTFGHGAPSWTSGNLLPIAVSDSDGDPIVSYRVTDVGTASTSAILWYGGSFLAQGATLEFTADNLQNFWLEGGTAVGTDTLRIQAYDGFEWSTAADITIASVASNQPLSSSSASIAVISADTFVFSPPPGSNAVTDLQPNSNAIELDHSLRAFVTGTTDHAAINERNDDVAATKASYSLTDQSIGLEKLLQHLNDFLIL